MATSAWGQAAEFEERVARDEDVSNFDINFSRLTGIAPSDVDRLKDFTLAEALLLVIRCPKRAARMNHGKYQPKTLATSLLGIKSDPSTGLVTLPNGTKQVSDYDLMCVYRFYGRDGYGKIFFSGKDPANKRSALSPEASALLRRVNKDLHSPFQHGAQDDYEAKDNPNVKMGGDKDIADRFAVFNVGSARYFASPAALKKEVYDRYGLDWPYDATGRHRAANT